MSWATPTQPNLNDYMLFVLFNMGIDPLYLPNVPPPATPVLTPGSGGSLASGTVYVVLTYVSATGETQASPEAATAVTGPTGSVLIASPAISAATSGATGYNVYASLVSGAEQLQAQPIAIGTPFTLDAVIEGASPPKENTAGSPWLGYAFAQAQGLVIGSGAPRYMWGNFPYPGGGIDYTLAVYNCAGHIQIKITPDQIVDNLSREFFQRQRGTYDLLKQSVGVVRWASNVDTSTSIAVPDSLAQLTLTDLDFIKTPWGRSYMQYAMDYGPTVWGLS